MKNRSIEIYKGSESYVQNCLEVGEQSDSPDQSSITPTEDCHNFSQFPSAELSQPEPPDTRSDEIVWKIRPTEAGSQNRSADEVASQIFKKRWVPQLKEFQATRREQYQGNDYSGFQPPAKKINHQTPEYLVKDPIQRFSDPVLPISRVEFSRKA